MFPWLTKSYFLYPYSLLPPPSLDCPPPPPPNSFPGAVLHTNMPTAARPARRDCGHKGEIGKRNWTKQKQKYNKLYHINQTTTYKAVASPEKPLLRGLMGTTQ